VREEESGAEVREEAMPPTAEEDCRRRCLLGLPRTTAEAMPQRREGAYF